MGWEAINNTASRRANLEALNQGTTQLNQLNTTLTTAVAQLAKTRGILNNLAKTPGSVNVQLIRQFDLVDRAFQAMKKDVELGVEMADEFNRDYQLPRNQRPGQQQLSGSSMASAVKRAAYSATTDLRWAKQMTARDLPTALNNLTRNSPLLSVDDKKVLKALAATLAPPN
ncbi:MAG: hypothetical protein QE278_13295 [Limnobacter sp.]|nr:hypothetical protein [Limnobacter sp.]